MGRLLSIKTLAGFDFLLSAGPAAPERVDQAHQRLQPRGFGLCHGLVGGDKRALGVQQIENGRGAGMEPVARPAGAGLCAPQALRLRLRGQLKYARGVYREDLQDYQKTALSAFGDVENALAQLNTTTAQIPSQEDQVSQQINALSLLLGEPPQALRVELETGSPLPPIPPLVPVGVPSELARRRPDIREAEEQLHSATANVGVAVAAFYPRVTLTGALNFQTLSLRDLAFWSSVAYTIGPSISLPIFQGGRLRGQLQLNKAREQEAAISYQQTVLTAWRDIDNALASYAAEQRRHDQLAQSVTAAQRALSLAQQQYAHGLQSFLNVLDAQRTLLSAQQQLATSTAMESGNLVQLYNALGGGWETTFPEVDAAAAGGSKG